MSMFIVLFIVWGLSGTSYWLFRSMVSRRYNAYAAGRLDTLYVVFMLMTLILIISGSIIFWG